MLQALLPLEAMKVLEGTQPMETLVPEAVPSGAERGEENAVALVAEVLQLEAAEVEAEELKEPPQVLEEVGAMALLAVRTAEGSSGHWEASSSQTEQDSAKQVDLESPSQEPGQEDEREQEDKACSR